MVVQPPLEWPGDRGRDGDPDIRVGVDLLETAPAFLVDPHTEASVGGARGQILLNLTPVVGP